MKFSEACANITSRKQWRRDHPFGFFAKPMRGANGMMDLKKWDCGVPGKEKTIWEGGLFKLEVTFPEEYPTKPPKCTFLLASTCVATKLRLGVVIFMLTDTSQASLYLRYSTPTCTHQVQSACPSSTKKKVGSLRSQSRRFCWAFSRCLTSQTRNHQRKQTLSTSSRRTERRTRRRCALLSRRTRRPSHV